MFDSIDNTISANKNDNADTDAYYCNAFSSHKFKETMIDHLFVLRFFCDFSM